MALLLVFALAWGIPFTAAASDGPGPSAICTTCCPEPPCQTPTPQPKSCTVSSGDNTGCSGMRYPDEDGIYGPCTLTSTSMRGCSCAPGSGTQACLGNGNFGVCRYSGNPTYETCNSCDDNHDGAADNIHPKNCYLDKLGACAYGKTACSNGAQVCRQVNFPVQEVCDDEDNDCDGKDDITEFGYISCGTGACYDSRPACIGGTWQTCTPGTPSAEVCDGEDNDCDGSTDEGFGVLSCGQGRCANSVPACSNGRPQTCVPLPSEPERCDGQDNDCDLVVDEGSACRFDSTSCACTPIPQAQACASTACGTSPDGCGGSYSCGACPAP
jgi:hypothetical protein